MREYNKKGFLGETFNRLTVIRRNGSKNGSAMWRCVCSCGKECDVRANALKKGTTKSCGCLGIEKSKIRLTKHGMEWTHFIRVWRGIKARCKRKPAYVGKGIVCEWDSFPAFKQDMYGPYVAHVEEHGEADTTIERIDNDGNYSPENCRWATKIEQQANRSITVRLVYKGETKTLMEWCRELGLNHNLIRGRLCKGWSIERAFITPSEAIMRRRKNTSHAKATGWYSKE